MVTQQTRNASYLRKAGSLFLFVLLCLTPSALAGEAIRHATF